jgi:molybdopterin-guanine dinucleotide biosynthesis protein A
MGRDKALLPFRQGTLVGEICRAVECAAGNVTLVGHRELPSIPDFYPGEGPLGGILTALRHTRAEWNLIVACDMPEVHAGFLSRLLSLALACHAHVLLPSGADGQVQPLCAVYHRSALGRLQNRFASGTRAIAEALSSLTVERVTIAEAEFFQNVNTPQDWAAYDAK